jgi:PAS domain S-box-containing protein
MLTSSRYQLIGGFSMIEKPTYHELEQRVKEPEAFEAKREKNVVALEHLFELSLDMLCVADMNTYFKHINNAFEKTLGYTKEKLLKESFLHFIHPSDIDSTIAEVEKLSLGEPTIYFENRYRCKDNSYKWLAWTSMPDLEHGLMYAVARDITEQKVSEQALSESEKRYRLLFNSMLSGFALHEIIYDENGKPCDYRFLDLNPSFERLTGLRRIDTLGKTVCEVLPKIETYWIDTYGEVVLSGKPAHFENYSEELDRYYEVVAFRPQKNQFAVTFTDITARIRSEEALRESEERHRLLLKVSPDPIVVYDIEGKTIYVNPAFEKTFGWSLDELREKKIDFVPEENWPETKEAISRMLQGEKIQLFETRRLTKDGRILDIQLSSSLFFDRNEKPVGNMVILRDITFQKQAERTLRNAHDELEQQVKKRTAELVSTTEKLKQEIKEHLRTEEALRESKERFRNLTEITSDWIWEVDKNGFYTYVSPKIQDMLGYQPEEIIGKTPFDLMPPEEADRVFNIFNIIRASKEPFNCLENIYLHKNGHPVILESSGVPIFDADGEICCYRGIDRDITGRKQTEKALIESRESYRILVETMNDGLGIQDEKGTITFVNSKFGNMLGYKPENLIGKSVSDLLDDKNKQILKNQFSMRKKGEVSPYQIEWISKDGKSIPSIMSPQAVFDEKGQFKGSFSVITDISILKQVEEELRKTQDELEKRVEERTRELEIQKSNLEEVNIALQVLLDKRHEDKKEMEENVLTNAKEMMIPYFKKLRKTKLNVHQKTILSILESYLNEIVSPFVRKMSKKYSNLTPTEIEVIHLIRFGSSSKEIADIMCLSPRTIYNHRKNIRKKLRIENKETNLRSHLLSIF